MAVVRRVVVMLVIGCALVLAAGCGPGRQDAVTSAPTSSKPQATQGMFDQLVQAMCDPRHPELYEPRVVTASGTTGAGICKARTGTSAALFDNYTGTLSTAIPVHLPFATCVLADGAKMFFSPPSDVGRTGPYDPTSLYDPIRQYGCAIRTSSNSPQAGDGCRPAGALASDAASGKPIACAGNIANGTWVVSEAVTTGVHSAGEACDSTVDKIARDADGKPLLCVGSAWSH